MGCVVSNRKVFLKVLEVQGQKYLQIQTLVCVGVPFSGPLCSHKLEGARETLVHDIPSSFNHKHALFIPHDKHIGIPFSMKLFPLICLSSSSLYTDSSSLQAENVRYLPVNHSLFVFKLLSKARSVYSPTDALEQLCQGIEKTSLPLPQDWNSE